MAVITHNNSELNRDKSNQCAFDTEHGLDCYLSLRIRHGTMSGILRSSAERESIVTRKTKESNEYAKNTHWPSILIESLGSNKWNEVELRLARFSSDFDKLITALTNDYVQILRDDKPDGKFEISLNAPQIFSVASELKIDTTFPEFIDRLLELFWGVVQNNLVSVRKFMKSYTTETVKSLFDELETEVRTGEKLVSLADAVLRARNETLLAVDQVRDWFELPAATSSLMFEVEDLVKVSLETVQSFHSEFNPDLSINTNDLPAFAGALILFSDIFFIIFENIHLHSGTNTPKVNVNCYYEDRKIKITVSNSLSGKSRIVDIEEKLDTIKKKLVTGDYLSAVRLESGSGLPKLAKLIGYRENNNALDFDVDIEKKSFWISCSLAAHILNDGGDSATG